MLVLSRKKTETIVFDLADGQSITVRVLEIKGDTVKLGVEAPRELKVRRGELEKRDDPDFAMILNRS